MSRPRCQVSPAPVDFSNVAAHLGGWNELTSDKGLLLADFFFLQLLELEGILQINIRFTVRGKLVNPGRGRLQPLSGIPTIPSRQSSWPLGGQYSARAACEWIPPNPAATRQWIPPGIPPEQPAVDPAKYPAEYSRVARQRILPSMPPSIPAEQLASGSRQESR